MLTESQINDKVTMEDVMSAIEHFYQTSSVEEALIPERMHIEDKENTALLMPAFHGNYHATKLANVAPGNPERGLSTIQALVILADRQTLQTLEIMDGNTITALKTGAVGGLGMKYMATAESKTLGIVGTGIQGWSHLEAALVARPIQKVILYNRTKEKAVNFKHKIEEKYPEVAVCISSLENLIEKADIIVTTTTSKTSVIPEYDEKLYKGKLIVGVGSFRPDMQEIPDSLLHACMHWGIDSPTGLKESGDMIRAGQLGLSKDDVMSLDALCNSDERKTITGVSIFKSVGMSLFDLLTAQAIYEKENN
ncbi:ornithine cyclodeaminase family protein [Natribacillus halophilus]|uniref:Ornithine cyclodeaminase n=1 Tax=Natribacillus halophilus TaxID=549003 RepID=A0A1G8R985_9BACI|nr:NAD(P)-binding domain-containing protein [Natribacillus halophilus]SDJ13526.1 ornithine cyclodeaminase [Natribacillus halophilus]